MSTVVNARLPWALYLPLAGVTELGGFLLLLSGHGIGWAAVLAPIIGFLAMRGQMTLLQQGKKQVIANLGGDDLKSLIKVNDWNQLHIIARGNELTHVLNGRLMAAAIDDDATNRAMGGLIGFQLHQGLPMKVEYRNIWLKGL